MPGKQATVVEGADRAADREIVYPEGDWVM